MFSMCICMLVIFYCTDDFCAAYNYCSQSNEEEFCMNTAREHIMCHENILEKQGELVAVLPMSRKLKQIILDKHNECRNELAAGNVTDEAGFFFPKASRLREFIWDRELAFIARLHASHCTEKHDKCHNTERFRNSGQNLGWAGDSEPQSVSQTLRQIIQNMCDERILIPYATDFPSSYPKDMTTEADFTMIANERVSRVGCGFAYCQNCKREHCYYLTCNYDYGVPIDNQVYEPGLRESASHCDDWSALKSTKYKHLCRNNPDVYKYD